MSVDNPFFSIVVPSYNRAKFLPHAIISVMEQTFSDWELLVIDDCSTDNTGEIVVSYNDPRIRYIRNQKNIERSASRNKGIELSRGEYICFLDSDDHYLPAHLEKLHNAIQVVDDKMAMFFTCFIRKFADKEEKVIYLPKGHWNNVEYMMSIQVPPSCTCFHKDILKEFQFNLALNVNEDIELFVRILSKYPLEKVDAYTMVMNIHGGNTKFVESGILERQFKAANAIMANPDVKKHISPAYEKFYLASLHRKAIAYHLEKGTLEQARASLWYHITQIPGDERNKSYSLLFIYSLPGGRLLRKLVAWVKK